MNNPATSRQLWALYCITKKDYRNENLTKDEAAKLIKELGDQNYKKSNKAKSIKEQLLDFMKEKFDSIKLECAESLKCESELIDDPEFGGTGNIVGRFVGVGCGFTYLTYDKRSNKAKAIDEASREIHYNEVEKMWIDTFTPQQKAYYNKIGCPLEAIWSQDQGMQISYYSKVVEFANSIGVKMSYKSFLD